VLHTRSSRPLSNFTDDWIHFKFRALVLTSAWLEPNLFKQSAYGPAFGAASLSIAANRPHSSISRGSLIHFCGHHHLSRASKGNAHVNLHSFVFETTFDHLEIVTLSSIQLPVAFPFGRLSLSLSPHLLLMNALCEQDLARRIAFSDFGGSSLVLIACRSLSRSSRVESSAFGRPSCHQVTSSGLCICAEQYDPQAQIAHYAPRLVLSLVASRSTFAVRTP
jgi:hypothetical protein